MNIISYGGGVQSSVIVLKAVRGEWETKPDAVIFCDTGSESKETYATVAYVQKECEKVGLPFYTAYADFRRNMEDDPEHIKGFKPLHEWYRHYQMIPMVGNPRCTFNFKIYPFRRLAKSLVDQTGPKPWVYIWLGITTDERHRAEHEEDLAWISNRYPLLEIGMSRQACISWLAKHYPEHKFAKSGCFMCMYQGSKNWAKLKREEPELFAIALDMERAAKANGTKRGLFGTQSIEAFNSDVTLEDFGFELDPADFDCNATGGCFL